MINELQFKFQQGQETFLLSRVFRPAHTAFYSVGNRGTFCGRWNSWTVKLTNDLPTNAVVKNEWSYTCTPSYAFTASTGMTLLYLFTRKCNIQNTAIYTSHGIRCNASYPLWWVYIQKISVSNIIWHKYQSYFCSLLRVGNLKVHKYGTTFRGNCLY